MSSRKYERYFKPISSQPFSTAGTHRNQGRVGQTSLSRSIVHTPFRGNKPRGHGANASTGYPVNIVNSCYKSSHSDGRSSMTSNGLFLSRVTNPTSVYNKDCVDHPCNQPTSKNMSPEYHSQGSLVRRNVNKLMAVHYDDLDGSTAKISGPQTTNLQGPMPFAKNVAPISSSDYIRTALPYKECVDASTCKNK